MVRSPTSHDLGSNQYYLHLFNRNPAPEDSREGVQEPSPRFQSRSRLESWRRQERQAELEWGRVTWLCICIVKSSPNIVDGHSDGSHQKATGWDKENIFSVNSHSHNLLIVGYRLITLTEYLLLSLWKRTNNSQEMSLLLLIVVFLYFSKLFLKVCLLDNSTFQSKINS
jgi:hypothetical protein